MISYRSFTRAIPSDCPALAPVNILRRKFKSIILAKPFLPKILDRNADHQGALARNELFEKFTYVVVK